MNNSIYPKYSKGADADAFEMLMLMHLRCWYWHVGACPFCLQLLEDTGHVFDCQHVESTTIWNKLLWQLALSLHKMQFPTEFIIAIKRDLTAMRFLTIPPHLSTYPEPIRSMICQQHLLGWNQCLLGLFMRLGKTTSFKCYRMPSFWNASVQTFGHPK